MTSNNLTYEWERDQARDVSAFVQGQQDCRNGKPHEAEKGESYDMGFAYEYQMEQILGATT